MSEKSSEADAPAAKSADSFVIAEEVADQEFDKFAEAWEIDTDLSRMDEDDEKTFGKHRRRMVSAIMRGRLTFDAANETLVYRPVLPPKGKTEIVMRVPSGAAAMSMDGTKTNQNMAKLNRYLGAMTGEAAGYFGSDRCSGIDSRVYEAAAALFLGS